MTDRPIIFSGPMVRALLEGRKTQTRRVIEKAAALNALSVFGTEFILLPGNIDLIGYAPGDRLYVREAWRAERGQDRQNATEIAEACLDAGYSRVWCPIFYEADARRVNFENGMVAGRYRHARFMPRWASRLTLTVTDVRVQRLQDMTGRDMLAEGVRCRGCHVVGTGDYSACRDGGCFEQRGDFTHLWNSLHGPDAWGQNPWVAAITFAVHRCNIDQMGDAARYGERTRAMNAELPEEQRAMMKLKGMM